MVGLPLCDSRGQAVLESSLQTRLAAVLPPPLWGGFAQLSTSNNTAFSAPLSRAFDDLKSSSAASTVLQSTSDSPAS